METTASHAVAAIFAIRAGWRDAREGRPPYLWSVFTHAATRHDLLRQGWADVGKVFIVAVVLDLTYELFAYRWVCRRSIRPFADSWVHVKGFRTATPVGS